MKVKAVNWKIWLPIILGLVYLLTRFVNLTIIPIFVDEAIYTRWSQIILADPSHNLFIPLSDGKQPLFMWVAAQFLRIFSDPLFATRATSVIAGLFGVWGTYLLAKELFNKRVGVLAAVLFIFCPFLLLYNRLAVVDGMLTTFFVFAVYFIFLLARDLKVKDSILLGLMLGFGVLTKSTAALAIIFIPFSIIFLYARGISGSGKYIKLFGLWLLTLVVAFVMYRTLKFSPLYYLIAQRTPDFIFSPKEILADPLSHFLPRFKDVSSWLLGYLTWPIYISTFLGLILLLKREWRIGIFLGVYFLGPLLIEMEIAKGFTPRYFIFIAPLALILAAYFLDFISDWLVRSDQVKIYSEQARYLLVAVLLIPCLIFEFLLLTNPPNAPIPQVEKSGYLEDWSAGYGVVQIADFLKIRAESGKAITVGTEGVQGFGTLPDGLEVYLRDTKNVTVVGKGKPAQANLEKVPDDLITDAQLHPAYLVVNKFRFLDNENPHAILVASFPKANGQNPLELFEIVP